MNKALLIIGAGQYGTVVEETARALNLYEKIEFLDDNSEKAIGHVCDYARYSNAFTSAFVAVGNPEFRLAQTDVLEKHGYEIATLIHPMAYVSPSAIIGRGVIVEPAAVVNPGVKIERCCIISAGAVINHDSCIEQACHIDCGAVVPSNTIVSQKYKLPCGAVFAAQSENNKSV